MNRKWIWLWVVILIAAFAVACGGGGGTTPVTPSQETGGGEPPADESQPFSVVLTATPDQLFVNGRFRLLRPPVRQRDGLSVAADWRCLRYGSQ